MSNDPQLQSINQSEFEAFLAAKMPNLACPGCAQEKFDTLVNQDFVTAARVHLPIGAIGYMPVLVTICDNCGYSIPVFWKTVHDWVEAKKNQGTDNVT
jgi:hypothetical protein